jgi:hypothetical protein
VEKLRWAIVICELPKAGPWMAEAERAGVRWVDVPRLDADPEALQQGILTALHVSTAQWEHGATSVPLFKPWPAAHQLRLFTRPDGMEAGPDLQLAPGVTLQTDGLIPLPRRGRFQGMPVEFVGPKLWASVQIPNTGGYDWRVRQARPPETRSALAPLPEFVGLAAKVASKEPAKQRRTRLA